MEARQQHILIEKIRLLYLHSLTPAMLSGIAAMFLVAALWPSANHQHLIIWLSITIMLAVMRVSLILMFKQKKPTGKKILKWEKPYSVSLFIVFLVWSIGLILVMPRDNLSSIFIVNTFSIGLAGAAISWYSPVRYLQVGTISLALIPMILVLLTLGHTETTWVGIAACCLFVSCISTSVILQKTLNGNLELAYDLEKSIKNAEVIARTDMLTNLNNRRAFFDIAPPLLAKCHKKELPASLIMFDIDYFKKINDAFGHAGGDVALQHVADLLRSKLRRSDISCRFGGEEFAVLLPNTNLKEAETTAEKLRALIASSPVEFSSNKIISLTASFGIADIGETLDEILNHADEAMYSAKNSGRNLVKVYSSSLTATQKKKRKFKSNKSAKVRESLQR